MTVVEREATPVLTRTTPVVIPPGPLKAADYSRLAREIRSNGEGLRDTRVAILASYTVAFSEPYLLVEGARLGRRMLPYLGAFGQFEQELVDPGSPLQQFAPDVLVLAMRIEDLDPDAVVRVHRDAGARLNEVIGEAIERLAKSVELFRSQSKAPVLVANFAPPALRPFGLFDANVGESLTYALARANATLRERIGSLPGTVVWDYAGLVAEAGEREWTDRRLWAIGRVAVASRNQPRFGAHLSRAIAAVRQATAKCLVLDLDNTLWGGVIGDDGLEGIKLGDDYPGNVFKSFQRRCLALRDRGILLAVVSKNDHDVAERAFREHPEMLIKWDDLAAVRINWGPKSANLLAVAEELNIGADALVFFDDNPVERAEVRVAAPDVLVVDVDDPLMFETALMECPWFDQTGLSGEDRSRAESYRQDRERRELGASFANVDEFLHSLEMRAEVALAGPSTIGRIAQLIGKTNQFNLTTRRHSQADVAAFAADPKARVASLRLTDRFGDQGLVVVGIVRARGDVAEIDTFLMSCRVMNRRVEHAFMSYLLEQARAMGCTRAEGEYLPTRKNGMVREFYPGLGFTRVGDAGDGGSRWAIDLADGGVAWPSMIARIDG